LINKINDIKTFNSVPQNSSVMSQQKLSKLVQVLALQFLTVEFIVTDK